jgi:hypothetical protein
MHVDFSDLTRCHDIWDDSNTKIRSSDALRVIPNVGAPSTLGVHIALSEYDMTDRNSATYFWDTTLSNLDHFVDDFFYGRHAGDQAADLPGR